MLPEGLCMQKRRTLLATIGTAGTVAIAGCSDTSEPQPESEPEQEETQEESEPEAQDGETEATIELTDPLTDGETYGQNDELIIGYYMENTGETTVSETVSMTLDGELVVEEEVELEPGEETNFGASWEDTTSFESKTYEYTVQTENEQSTATFTIEEPEVEETEATYQVRIIYDGDWSGSVGGDGSTRSVDGTGTETFDVDGDPFIVSANAQKQDDSNNELTVEILENGEVIAQESTTAGYGLAQVTSEDEYDSDDSSGDSNGDSSESSTTFSVRIEYNGDWSGSIGGDGSTRSVDGSGTETFDIEGTPSIVSANAQKQDDSSGTLTVQILEDGEVVEETSTSAEYGLAQTSHSNF